MVKIAIIGTGYVGLVSAACLAEAGNSVTAIDIDIKKIENLKKSIIPIYEPNLAELVEKNLANGNLQFSTSVIETLQEKPEICFIAVGTPHNKETNEADLTYLYQALNDILTNIKNNLLIVNKSTVPLGTADKMSKIIKDAKSKYTITIASNPEFLSQGSAVKDFMEPHRIVIGTENKTDKILLEKSYKYFTDKGFPLVSTNIASSELTKYAANSLLALKVAFINEIDTFAEHIGANIKDIQHALTLDPRIGNKFLNPGPGYGGSCFPKDTRALKKAAERLNIDFPIINNIDNSNEFRISYIADKISKIIIEKQIKSLSILGLTFKAGTDDVRDSQAIKIIKILNKKFPHLIIKAYDPKAKFKQDFKAIICTSLEEAKDSDAIVIITEWKEFNIDFGNKVVINLR